MQTFSNEIQWGLVGSNPGQVTELRRGTFSDLARDVTTHEVSPQKAGAGWTPASIQPGTRNKEQAGAWCVLVMDIEGAKDGSDHAPLAQIVELGLYLKEWSAALATSYSHEAPIVGGTLGPRFRLVFELNRPILAYEIKPLAYVVTERLGIPFHYVDKKCFDSARMFFSPRVPADRAHLAASAIIEGKPLDVGSLLEQAAPVTPARHTSQPVLTPESSLSVLGPPIDDVQMADLRDATMYLASKGHGADYGDWQSVGAALKAESSAGREPELYSLWLDYSRKCGNFESDAAVLRKWRNVGGDSTSKKAIFAAAAELGWVNPAIGRKVTAAPVANPTRYKLLSGKDLRDLPPLVWRVRGVLPAVGIATVFGPSASGKSFLAFDMAVAIAMGHDWHSCLVKAAPVVYAALEGESGFKSRAEAWEKHNDTPLPDGVRMMMQPFDITKPQDVQDLAAVALKGSVIFVDTLNRAAPSADENSSKDMGAILSGAKTLQLVTGGLVVLIHHTGKNEERGMRGHSSLFAAMDAAIEVSRNGDVRSWAVAKSKDGEDGKQRGFSLSVVELGEDSDGELVTSCVAVPGAAPLGKLSAGDQLCLETLQAADLFGDGVTDDDWRAGFYKAKSDGTPDVKPDSLRKAFIRQSQSLIKQGRVVAIKDRFIPTDCIFNKAGQPGHAGTF